MALCVKDMKRWLFASNVEGGDFLCQGYKAVALCVRDIKRWVFVSIR